MKKYLFVAAAAAVVALGSCTKSEVTKTSDLGENVIGFTNYAGRAVSKADEKNYVAKGSNLVDGVDFVVYAFNSGSNGYVAESFKANFMNKVLVKYNGGNETTVESAGKNTYSPVRYWPKDEDNNLLTFFSYYPADGDGITANVSTGLPTFSYKVSSDITKQTDFLLADVVKDQKYSATTNGVVPFVFAHQLVKVRFAVAQEEEKYDEGNTTITVNEIKLNGVLTEGTLAAKDKAAESEWSEVKTAVAFTVPKVDVELTKDVQPASEEPGNVYLFIPQELTDNITLDIEYTVKTGDVETVNNVNVKLSEFKNGDDAISKWEKNHSYIYTLTFGLKEILFSATTETWEDDTNLGIVIK